ncbi:MAG: PilZ domain-containing protein [Thermodesulfobacteriota bacterium]
MSSARKLDIDGAGCSPPEGAGGAGGGMACAKTARRLKVVRGTSATPGRVIHEKRRRERRYLVAEVRIRKAVDGGAALATTVNISDDGMGLYTRKPFRVGEKVSVRITVVVKGTEVVSEEVPGTIRWVEPIDKNFAAGVRFDTSIKREDFPVLHRCLEYAKITRSQER